MANHKVIANMLILNMNKDVRKCKETDRLNLANVIFYIFWGKNSALVLRGRHYDFMCKCCFTSSPSIIVVSKSSIDGCVTKDLLCSQ